MTSIERIVIVGAGLAGARAAEAVRKEGFEGSVTLLGAEPERPYNRPPLTKDYLRGETERDAVYVHPEAFYREQRIELRPTTNVRSIDVGARQVALEDEERIPFDRLLIATGASPKALPVPGADLPGVHNLRTLADADALRAAAKALGSERLTDCDLHVTLEPCTMCAAAISFARIRRLYFGAADPKGGAVEHGVRFFAAPTCHHRPEIYGAISESECAVLLKDFFQARRT